MEIISCYNVYEQLNTTNIYNIRPIFPKGVGKTHERLHLHFIKDLKEVLGFEKEEVYLIVTG